LERFLSSFFFSFLFVAQTGSCIFKVLSPYTSICFNEHVCAVIALTSVPLKLYAPFFKLLGYFFGDVVFLYFPAAKKTNPKNIPKPKTLTARHAKK